MIRDAKIPSRATVVVVAAAAALGGAVLLGWLWVDSGSGNKIVGDTKLARTVRTVQPVANWGIDSVAWVSAEHSLVIRAVEGPLHLSTMIYVAQINRPETRWRRLADLAKLGCRDPALISPVATGPRSFAFVEGCLPEDESPRRSKHIRRFSFREERLRTPYSYGLPFPARGFALEPGTRRGVLNDGAGLEERLRWLQPHRLSAPIPLPLDRVGDPVWSPTGQEVALPGVVGLGDAEGPARSLASRWNIVIADRRFSRVRIIDEVEFREQPSVAWSGDGSLLAVAGKTGNAEGEVLLLRPHDGKSIVVKSGLYGAVAWIDGSQLAVVLRKNYSGRGGDAIELMDVSVAISRLQGK